MTSKTSSLKMCPAQQVATDHDGASDAGTEGHHHHVIGAQGTARMPLSQQGQSRIVLHAKGNSEGFPAPIGEVQGRCVFILFER
jgi:hypothetical protein